jgi:hypothetical protein
MSKMSAGTTNGSAGAPAPARITTPAVTVWTSDAGRQRWSFGSGEDHNRKDLTTVRWLNSQRWSFGVAGDVGRSAGASARARITTSRLPP